jgi:hypothetical protein
VTTLLSVFLSDSTFAFGTSLLDAWLTPQASADANDGSIAEDFVGRISQFDESSIPTTD